MTSVDASPVSLHLSQAKGTGANDRQWQDFIFGLIVQNTPVQSVTTTLPPSSMHNDPGPSPSVQRTTAAGIVGPAVTSGSESTTTTDASNLAYIPLVGPVTTTAQPPGPTAVGIVGMVTVTSTSESTTTTEASKLAFIPLIGPVTTTAQPSGPPPLLARDLIY